MHSQEISIKSPGENSFCHLSRIQHFHHKAFWKFFSYLSYIPLNKQYFGLHHFSSQVPHMELTTYHLKHAPHNNWHQQLYH
jgi:hypothetical protein